jgi:hypothetical protein
MTEEVLQKTKGLLRYRSLETLTQNYYKNGPKNNIKFQQRVSRLC